MLQIFSWYRIQLTILRTVLHPYYKLAYIKLAWGGVEEQAKERAEGNQHTKNWQDEARKVVEAEVNTLPTSVSID